MNSAKKEIKLASRKPEKKSPITPMVWLITGIVVIVLLVAGILIEQLYQPVLLTINGQKYRLRDLSYYIYNTEAQYDYYNQLLGGTSWDMVMDESKGTTLRDTAKDGAISSAISSEVLYKEAMANNFSLTDDEKKTITSNVQDQLNGQLKESVIRKNNFTKKYLTDVITRITTANSYRDSVIDTLDVDDAKIKDGINYDEYKQYDIEYLYISTNTEDDDGNQVTMSDEDKQKAYDKIKAAYDKAPATKDWSTLVSEDEKELTYTKDGNFTSKSTTFTDEFKNKMKTLDNNAISQIFEDEKGYYVVRMINNNSSESYDNAVKDAITSAENDAFDQYYEDEILKKYTTTTNEKALDKLKMGEITLAP